MAAAVTPVTLTDRHPELGTGPLPSDPYWSDDFYQDELDAVFRRTWMYAGRAEELREPGDFVVKDIPTLELSLLFVRQKDGSVRGFHNVCQHRGNQLALDGRGHCLKFRCQFHGWAYGLDGRLLGVPDADGFPGLDRTEKGLREFPVDTWEGFIFFNLDPSPQWSLAEFLGQQARDLIGYPFDQGLNYFQFQGDVRCNWKSMIDSFCETYHVPHLHRKSITHTLAGPDNPFGRLIDVRLKGPHRTMSVGGNGRYQPKPVQALGFRYSAGPSVTSGGSSGQTTLPKGLNETRAPNWAIDVTAFFPNLIIVISSGMYFTHQMWPIGAHRVIWQMRGYLRSAANAAERFGQEHSIVELRDAVLEDANTLERVHRAMRQGLLPEVLFHDHELGLRHHYHTIVNWVEEYRSQRG